MMTHVVTVWMATERMTYHFVGLFGLDKLDLEDIRLELSHITLANDFLLHALVDSGLLVAAIASHQPLDLLSPCSTDQHCCLGVVQTVQT